MSEIVVTVWTATPPPSVVDADTASEKAFLRGHPNVFLEPLGDGTVRGKVHVETDDPEEAVEQARRLVAEAMAAAGRPVAPDDVSWEVADEEEGM